MSKMSNHFIEKYGQRFEEKFIQKAKRQGNILDEILFKEKNECSNCINLTQCRSCADATDLAIDAAQGK